MTVPPARERQVDFSQTGTVIRDPQTNAPFDRNVIPLDRINKNGQALLNIFPLPNAAGGDYNYIFQESLKIPKRQHLLRADYRLLEKDTFTCADRRGMPITRAVRWLRDPRTGGLRNCITPIPTTESWETGRIYSTRRW